MANMVKVNVKWGKKVLPDVEINLDDPPSVFKMQLWTLTGVAPSRQTVLGLKGGKLKDDGDWAKAAPKPGQTVMLMGTPDENSLAPPPAGGEIVRDDLDATTDDSGLYEARPDYPPGLDNLGNTCYMNSTLQCLKVVPELRTALSEFRGSTTALSPAEKLTAALRDLMSRMSSNNAESISPAQFLILLRQVNPQFGERGPQGMYMQQDAEECWGEILSRLASALKKDEAGEAPGQSNEVDQLFSMTMKMTDKCDEGGSDEVVHRSEEARTLKCHISVTVNHLVQGISDGLEETIEKQSETLNRLAKWKRTSRIDRLPPFLQVSMMRFFWKQEARVKAKIMRNVTFPVNLDVYDYCTEELKERLDVTRKAAREAEDARIAAELTGAARDAAVVAAAAAEAAGVLAAQPPVKNATEIEETGNYELCAVLTHKGRTAESGHYVAWVKDNGTIWLKYDDNKVSQHDEEEVKKLSGGGDWHTAYQLLYRRSTAARDDNAK
jgi:ubiquitin carboxyl-terminal hydrolase 14